MMMAVAMPLHTGRNNIKKRDMGYYDLTYDGPVVQAIADTANDLRLNGYIFKGTLAAGNVNVTSTEPSWWIGGPGTYSGAVSVTVPVGSVGVFALKNSTWTVTVVEVTSGDVTFASGEDVDDVSIFDDPSDLTGKTDAQKALMLPNGKIVDAIEAQIANVSSSFATGEDVGDVSIYDDPSDLTGKTDEEKALMLPNANALDGFAVDTIKNIPSDEWIKGTLKGYIRNDGLYVVSNSWSDIYLVPIQYASKVRVTAGNANAQVAFVTSAAMSHGGAVPFATGETGVHSVAANTAVTFNVPSDALYMDVLQNTALTVIYPSSVDCIYSAQSLVNELRGEMTDKDTELESEKQDKQYFVDLSNATIVAGRDDLNATNNSARATIRFQQCYKGDVIKCIKPTGSSGSGTMLLRTYDRGGNILLSNSGWISIYTIQEDGYYTAVVNSNVTNGGTAAFLLAALSQARLIETIAEQFVSERWRDYAKRKTIDRVLFDDAFTVCQFTGESPFANQVRWKRLATLNNSINQSMAIYNGYVFQFGNGMQMAVYEMDTFRFLQSTSSIVTNFHANASWFSGEFYDPTDAFPILYSQANNFSPAICGFRIQNVNGTWSITKVHEIYRDGETGGALVIYDRQNDTLIYNSPRTEFVTYKRPKYSESESGASTLTDADIISTISRTGTVYDYGQGNSVFGNIAVGITYAVAPGNTIFGADLKTGENTFTLTPPSGFDEGEGMCFYEGRLYITDVRGRFYEIIFP